MEIIKISRVRVRMKLLLNNYKHLRSQFKIFHKIKINLKNNKRSIRRNFKNIKNKWIKLVIILII